MTSRIGTKRKSFAKPVGIASVWFFLAGLMLFPFIEAAVSPLQASRELAYVVGGLAGILGLILLLAQPLLAAGYLPGATIVAERRWHRWLGIGIAIAVLVHVVGLYLTSPDDMKDALLLAAPTPFSVYGVIGLWAIICTAILVSIRNRNLFSHKIWNIAHNALAIVVVLASVVHAFLIEGAMGYTSKLILCFCIVATTFVALVHVRVLRPLRRKRKSKLALNNS